MNKAIDKLIKLIMLSILSILLSSCWPDTEFINYEVYQSGKKIDEVCKEILKNKKYKSYTHFEHYYKATRKPCKENK